MKKKEKEVMAPMGTEPKPAIQWAVSSCNNVQIRVPVYQKLKKNIHSFTLLCVLEGILQVKICDLCAQFIKESVKQQTH